MITHVAIEQNGVIYSLAKPKRHSDIINSVPEKEVPSWKGSIQGFIDDNGTFLTREEAFIVTMQIGQIKGSSISDRLFSEDLW